jgi:hypothetical protein
MIGVVELKVLAICFKSETRLASRALALDPFKATLVTVARIPMMTITTSNSIKVNPEKLRLGASPKKLPALPARFDSARRAGRRLGANAVL